jgi:hypothetical protein
MHYTGGLWTVIFSDEAATWWEGLPQDDFDAFLARVELLEQHGPDLGRPVVDSISGSRHSNMKELRVRTIRALFIFDAERQALVLVGGDKRGDWAGWYERNIPLADDLYDSYLEWKKGS